MDNRLQKKGFILLLAAFYLGVMIMAATPCEAKWWIFGKSDGTPEFASIKFNSVSVENIDEQFTLAKDDLVSGEITVRGQAEVGEGTIGKVEISFDGGEKWQKATLGDRGMFTMVFKPELEQEYDFRIKALSTTGKSSDLEDHSFLFTVGAMPNTDNVKAAFMEMLRLYMAEDRAGFMRLVHRDFEGDRTALEDAISDDFLFFDNIRIEPNITRIIPFDGNYELYFTFNRQVQVANSGELIPDSAASSMTFARGSGFLLYEMAAPLIFGVSNPADLATNVTEESIGSEVLNCNQNGDCAKVEQGDSTEPEGDAGVLTGFIAGARPYNPGGGFNFSTGSQDDDWNTQHFAWDALGGGIFPPAGSFAMDLGFGSINDVNQVSTSISDPEVWGVQVGQLVALKLPGGAYAVIEVTSITGDPIYEFEFAYKYNPSGNTF